MGDDLFSDGKLQYVDCSNGDGITLQTLTDMLRRSSIELPLRFDEVLITPVVINGKLALEFRITDQKRHAAEHEVITLVEIP